jgi:hypothetical protein
MADKDSYAIFPAYPDDKFGRAMAKVAGYASGYYRVVNETALAAVYNSIYYRSVGEVIADLMDRIKTEEVGGKWGADFAIWTDGRILAVLHEPWEGEQLKVVRFTEEDNDPGGTHHAYARGWPTREQWIESGRGPLWFDGDNPENPAGFDALQREADELRREGDEEREGEEWKDGPPAG